MPGVTTPACLLMPQASTTFRWGTAVRPRTQRKSRARRSRVLSGSLSCPGR
jgi:hypothetical protein